MRVSTGLLFNTMMQDVAKYQERMNSLREDIATGKSLRKPSDDPLGASRAVTIRALLAGAEQHEANVRDAREWLSATEMYMSQAQDLLVAAKDAAIKGANDALTGDARKAIAYDINQMIEDMFRLANSQHEGRYIFAGLKTTTPSFTATRDADGIITSVTYGGDSKLKMIEAEDDVNVQVNLPGDQAFGASGLFSTLIALRDHLMADNGDEIRQDVGRLDACIDKVTEMIGQLGARSARLGRAATRIEQTKVELAASLSKIEDTDIAKATVALELQQVIYKAALAAGAQVIQPTLLDYLR
ncbi:MAG: flagellar hook-associated protein FlgL [Firmicutes bacterium]|nr:flagellar hook-associated protein FlgL [Bacillota bacterium]